MNGQDAVAGLTCDEVGEMAGAFVLGALDDSDDAAVRAHLAACTEAHEELAELGGAVTALGESVPMVEPPAGLKARIMAAAAADLEARIVDRAAVVPVHSGAAGRADAVPRATGPTLFPTASERDARRSRASAASWILRIAAVLAIVALGGWNILLQGQVDGAKTHEQNLAAVLAVAAKPGSLTAILSPVGGTGSGIAAVDARGEIAIAMQDLAPTSGNTVYEAWIIGSDGVPGPLGSFKVGDTGTAYLASRDLPPASGTVLALTLEPGPNALQPTLPIISKGVAIAPG